MARPSAAALLFVCSAFAASPEQRAIAYLAQEVPRWKAENHCFSCHNNGDGARALYAAQRAGYEVPADALAETTVWLAKPGEWEQKAGEAGFRDRKLSWLQFSSALQASEADRRALLEAATALAKLQESDGSWRAEGPVHLGSPATWGAAVATYNARRVLEAAGAKRFEEPIQRANDWFARLAPTGVIEYAALAMAAGSHTATATLLTLQNPDGGWGPYRHTPSEPFDTAVAVLALQPRPAAARGRAFLLNTQLTSGAWPATTRPPGNQSYAQHISTTAWATMALIATAK